MIETYVTYLLWDGCGAPGDLECNGRRCGEIVDAVPFDRDALLNLADELESTSETDCRGADLRARDAQSARPGSRMKQPAASARYWG